MSPNYVPYGGLEACQREVALTLLGNRNRKKL